MSNKSRLQTNNTNLQALINKANALPDAGGGASVEMCTVTITCDAPSMDSSTVFYTDANMQLASKSFDIMSGTIIEVVGGTIITLSPWTGMSISSGDCTELFKAVSGAAYFIVGESTIKYG